MRIQSSHAHDARGLDPYFTPPEATWSLIEIEKDRIPRSGAIWEPAAGDGAIARILSDARYTVFASDIADYGAGFELQDYMTATPPPRATAIVTNPPFRLAEAFAQKALVEVIPSIWFGGQYYMITSTPWDRTSNVSREDVGIPITIAK